MKPLPALMVLLVAAAAQVSFAQEADKRLMAESKSSRARLESSLKEYVVVFNASRDMDRARLGIPLASFADGQVNLAYDVSGRNVMAQWTFAQTSVYGNKINYRAYVGDAGVVSLGVSSRF